VEALDLKEGDDARDGPERSSGRLGLGRVHSAECSPGDQVAQPAIAAE
jgi:hypothetical protein